MQVSQISSTNFSSRQKVLDGVNYSNFQKVKEKIGKGHVIHSDNVFWHKRIGYIRLDDVFFSNLNPIKVMLGKSELEINDDGSYKILKKPFFKTKKSLINKLGSYLSYFAGRYDQPNAVEKKYIMDMGYIDEQDGKVYITERKWL